MQCAVFLHNIDMLRLYDMQVIVEVAPDTLYNELLTEVFKDSLFDISSHHCGNFVVQALVSSAKTKDQVGTNFK